MIGGELFRLTVDQIEQVHSSSLEVLRRVGMQTKSRRILEVFAEGGAEVNFEGGSIKVPEHLIREALKSAPKQFMLYGRDSKYDIHLGRDQTYFSFGSTPPPFIRDAETSEFRRPTKNDFVESTRVGDALPNLEFMMTTAGAYDVPYQVEYLYEWSILLNNSHKPIVYPCPSAYEARKVLQMASLVVGGLEELRKRPILAGYLETVAPLTFAELNENMIEFASAGVPIVHGGGAMVGATGPGTLVGSLVQSTAENLAVLVLTQLVNRGTPVVYSDAVCMIDPKTGRALYGAPENGFQLGVGMAKYYGLPSWGTVGATDSKLPDAQAGVEFTFRALTSALRGPNLQHDCGVLASGSVGSLEMAVIANEVIGMISRLMRGVQFDEERLATDVICEVGPGGNYLAHKHTLKYIRDEIWLPEIFDRKPEGMWIKAGKKDISQVAREKVRKILAEHFPEVLPKNMQQQVMRILKDAERKLVKS